MLNTEFNWQMIIVWLLGIMLVLSIVRAIYSLWGRNDIHQSTKLLWTIFFILAPFFSFFFYMFFGGKSDFEVEEEEEEAIS